MKPWLTHYDPDVRPSLAPYFDKTLIDYLDQLASEHPSNTALLFKGATMAYGTLDALRRTQRSLASFIEEGRCC